MSSLLAGLKGAIESQIDRGVNLKWSPASNLDQFAASLSQLVKEFDIALDCAIAIHASVEARLAYMNTCTFNVPALKAEMDLIQRSTDSLDFVYLRDLNAYIDQVNTSAESILMKRLGDSLKAFTTNLDSPATQDGACLNVRCCSREPMLRFRVGFLPHVVMIADDKVQVKPMVDGADLYARLNEITTVASALSKISAPRTTLKEKKGAKDSSAFTLVKFSTLVEQLPAGSIDNINSSIRARVQAAGSFVDQWAAHFDYWCAFLSSDCFAGFKLLSRTVAPRRFAELPNDLATWRSEVQELYKTKCSLTDSITVKNFGAVQVKCVVLVPFP